MAKSEQQNGNRVILVHLYVEADPSDTRTADEIGDFVLASYEVGSEGNVDNPTLHGVEWTLCDEIEGPGPFPKVEAAA